MFKSLTAFSVRFAATAAIACAFGVGAVARTPQTPSAPAGGQGAGRGPQAPPLMLTTTAFQDGGVIPDKFTQAAGPAAVSPELTWSQVPAGTQSFVVLLHDPEPVLNKSSKMDITHWLVWNIPATSTGLAEGTQPGEMQNGTRQLSLRSNGFMGPGAPAGPYHHYTFELYALDNKVDVPQPQGQISAQQAADTRNAVVNAMDGHVLGKAVLVGRFHR
jgi:Raf kinase inhibitor-like YbhB/YbcL family protein